MYILLVGPLLGGLYPWLALCHGAHARGGPCQDAYTLGWPPARGHLLLVDPCQGADALGLPLPGGPYSCWAPARGPMVMMDPCLVAHTIGGPRAMGPMLLVGRTHS